MAGSVYYDKVNNALQNLNAQLNEGARRRQAAEFNLAQTQLQTAKFFADQNDPRRILDMEKAAEELRPTVINIKNSMPEGKRGFVESEEWEKFKPYLGNIVGDMNATVKDDGTVMGFDGRPMTMPVHRARRIQNRINAATMLHFDEETIRQGKLREMERQIGDLKTEYKKTNNPALKMQIRGLEDNFVRQQVEYLNPNRRLLSLQGKLERLDQATYQSFSDGADPSWVAYLKDQSMRTQDEINTLLKQMGKTSEEKGIQLQRYYNPVTKEVIEYPVSKFEGAAFRIKNPIVGKQLHRGTFVLKDDSDKPLSNVDVIAKVRDYLGEVRTIDSKIVALKNSLASEFNIENFKGLNIDSDTLMLMANSKNDKDAVNAAIKTLEIEKNFYTKELKSHYKDPQVKGLLESYYGTDEKPGYVKDDLGLIDTPTGAKYKNSGAPGSLFK